MKRRTIYPSYIWAVRNDVEQLWSRDLVNDDRLHEATVSWWLSGVVLEECGDSLWNDLEEIGDPVLDFVRNGNEIV